MVAIGGVDAFVELFWIAAASFSTALEEFHQPFQPVRGGGAVGGDTGELVSVRFPETGGVSTGGGVLYAGELGVDFSTAFFFGSVFSWVWIWEELELLRVLACSLRTNF